MLSKFPNKTLKLGARVSLSPQHNWHRGNTNPVGVVGRVSSLEGELGSSEFLQVRWENGRNNSYQKSDYDLIAEGEPGYLEV